ncbi:uncharacterized protein LAESUDRAFT_641589, partial [Laetiporus sulphureus 93-53]
DDGYLIAWDLKTGYKLQELNSVFHGLVISMRWIDLGKGDNLAFVFGCADGTLQVYQRDDDQTPFIFCSSTSAHNGFVQYISFDPNHGWIASIGGGTVHV